MNHEHKENLIERLRIELTDSIGFCFTGRINRMVNSLVGSVEGVKVSFSMMEQIQLESQMIIKRLISKNITFETAKTEMKEIFNDEVIKNDPALSSLEIPYVESLDDYYEWTVDIYAILPHIS